MPWSAELEVDVAHAVPELGSMTLRGWAKGPDPSGSSVAPVLYCLAGGGCSAGYFDLAVDGDPTYSMADHCVDAGLVVVALDHPGIGRSDPVEDLYAVTPSLVARAHAAAVPAVLDRLGSGSVTGGPGLRPSLVVGVGHSMGGLLAAVQQAGHRSFAALVSLGRGGKGLPEVLTSEERRVTDDRLADVEDRIVELARRRFAPGSSVPRRRPATGCFFADDVPSVVRRAFADQSVPVLPSCGLASMIPGTARGDVARIDVPVFVAFGDQDLHADHWAAAHQYRDSRDVTLFLLEDSGHCHNQARTRRVLWDRLVAWTREMVGIAPAATPHR